MVDYEEQVFITGIKANMQCSIWLAPTKKREIVTKSWDLRTYESTWDQLQYQVNNLALQWDKTADGWLHPRESVACDHKYVNINAILLSNILH